MRSSAGTGCRPRTAERRWCHEFAHGSQLGLDLRGRGEASEESTRRRIVARLTEQEHALDAGAGGDVQAHLLRRAGVEPGPVAAVEAVSPQIARGRDTRPLRPRKAARSPLQQDSLRAAGSANPAAKTTPSLNTPRKRLRASRAPAGCASSSVTTKRPLSAGVVPKTRRWKEKTEISRSTAARLCRRKRVDLQRRVAGNEDAGLLRELGAVVVPDAVAEAVANLGIRRAPGQGPGSGDQ